MLFKAGIIYIIIGYTVLIKSCFCIKFTIKLNEGLELQLLGQICLKAGALATLMVLQQFAMRIGRTEKTYKDARLPHIGLQQRACGATYSFSYYTCIKLSNC